MLEYGYNISRREEILDNIELDAQRRQYPSLCEPECPKLGKFE